MGIEGGGGRERRDMGIEGEEEGEEGWGLKEEEGGRGGIWGLKEEEGGRGGIWGLKEEEEGEEIEGGRGRDLYFQL